ncbi:hypothetical protein LB456_09045 [Psychroflexus sp. CAK57W]|uniref:hypothetical protein n=1 Tax=Psychroflexus curvus TaxID=2873595 RepID=UPI001CCFC988|nr:hypothetical protein [Psychroflexus curvus]MBZ9787600.1 hypothetical protein [Psychroflexus curvus]
MNRLLISFFFIFFINTFSSISQNNFNNYTDLYNYWAKRSIVEATYAYIVDDTLQRKINESEKKGLYNFKTKYVNNADLRKDVDLNEISAFLGNNSWSITNERIFSKLFNRFKKKDSLNRSFFDIEFIDNSYKNWNNKVDSLIKGYNEELNKLSTNKVINSNPTKTSRSRNQAIHNSYYYEFLYVLIFILIGFLAGFFTFYKYNKRQIKKIIGDKYLDYKSASNDIYLFGYLNAVAFLKDRKEDYKEEKKKLKVNKDLEIESLNEKLKRHQNKNIEISDSNEKVNKNNEDERAINKPVVLPEKKEVKNNILFFTIPEGDGSFIKTNGEETYSGKNYFKISFEESSLKGDLFYISGQRDGRAINRLDTNLKPVCEIENISNASTANRVELIEKGKVTLQGEKWVIDPNNKVKIRLI